MRKRDIFRRTEDRIEIGSSVSHSGTPVDTELSVVIKYFSKLASEEISSVFRYTFDQIYDGQRTGRFSFDQLYKTEKTHFGTLVEINLQKKFGLMDGNILDFSVEGIEVDCKFSKELGGWMIPDEAREHICLLLWADDQTSCWSLGIVRTTATYLNTGTNRDKKSTLNRAGRDSIHWLRDHAKMPTNILLQLDRTIIDRIMSLASGQERINELFRHILGHRVSRQAVATVARQEDYMKRIRDNGGARSALRPEGIVILGEFRAHVEIAQKLGVEIPGPGDSVAVRLSPGISGAKGTVEIGGQIWKVAGDGDEIVGAPILPKGPRLKTVSGSKL